MEEEHARGMQGLFENESTRRETIHLQEQCELAEIDENMSSQLAALVQMPQQPFQDTLLQQALAGIEKIQEEEWADWEAIVSCEEEEGTEKRIRFAEWVSKEIAKMFNIESNTRYRYEGIEQVERMRLKRALWEKIASVSDAVAARKAAQRRKILEQQINARVDNEQAVKLHGRQTRAVLKLQAWQRGNWGRARAENYRLQRSVTQQLAREQKIREEQEFIQSELQRHEDACRLFEQKHAAAILIQSLWRGFLVRQRKFMKRIQAAWLIRIREQTENTLMQLAEIEQREIKTNLAAATIQRRMRICLAKNSKQRRILRLQQLASQLAAQSVAEERETSVVKIQKLFRQHNARRIRQNKHDIHQQFLLNLKYEQLRRNTLERDEAYEWNDLLGVAKGLKDSVWSLAAKQLWNGEITNYKLQWEAKLERKKQDAAAKVIQTRMRGYLARKGLDKRREQAKWRQQQQKLARELNMPNRNQRMAAATKIQAVARAYKIRKNFPAFKEQRQPFSILVWAQRIERLTLMREEVAAWTKLLGETWDLQTQATRRNEILAGQRRRLQRKSAIMLQNWWRIMLSKLTVKILRELKEERFLITRSEKLKRRSIERLQEHQRAEIWTALHRWSPENPVNIPYKSMLDSNTTANWSPIPTTKHSTLTTTTTTTSSVSKLSSMSDSQQQQSVPPAVHTAAASSPPPPSSSVPSVGQHCAAATPSQQYVQSSLSLSSIDHAAAVGGSPVGASDSVTCTLEERLAAAMQEKEHAKQRELESLVSTPTTMPPADKLNNSGGLFSADRWAYEKKDKRLGALPADHVAAPMGNQSHENSTLLQSVSSAGVSLLD
eukprot:TRINITY_DN66191_c4_g8_i1.p1 TRINITY_DN66191_c4_g8~~TRINITY_DN66191_c4_g8_i1.p1  ORF type:complete len:836 (+),score=76.13 TRINITY_DN66191_c4_g8_i1:18-2525(+)